MKTLIGVESFDEVMNRSISRADKISRGEPVRAERRVIFETAEDMMAYLTPQRLRLIRMVREHPLSISALAASLERNRGAVTRDVKALRTAGLVSVKRAINPGHGSVQLVQARAKTLELRATI
jgi:predicted transcriptional regulator